MFKSKTVFVVGAGASKEAGFPIGRELKGTIANLLDLRSDYGTWQSGDRLIITALDAIARENGERSLIEFQHACWRIRDAMPQSPSIDSFLENHSNNKKIVVCGKLAIARAISMAEKESDLYLDHNGPSLDHNKIAKTWYGKLFERLMVGRSESDLEKFFDNVTIISFNYDRSVEQYFPRAIQNFYGVSIEEAFKITKSLKIIHPYGTCGCLPWQDGPYKVEFGNLQGRICFVVFLA